MFTRDIFRAGRWRKAESVFAISSVSASVTSDTTAAVEWYLTAGGSGQVEYGLTSSYGSTTTEETQELTYHQQVVSGLTAGTLYHYRVTSTRGGQTIYSDDATFTTSGASGLTAGPRAAPAQPTGPLVKVIGTDTAAVDDTGATDVTAALQSILNGLSAGETLVFDQTGTAEGYIHGTDTPLSTYKISGTLNLNNVVNNVTLWGYGTLITMPVDGGPMFRTYGTDQTGFTFAGFELKGSNEAYSRTPNIYAQPTQGSHGLTFWRRHNNTVVEDCWMHHLNGDGINQPGWASLDWNGCDDNTVRFNRIEDNKRQGIVPNVGLRWNISYNVLGNQGGFNIDAEDVKWTQHTAPSLSLTIEYNTFEQTTWARSEFVVMRHINCVWGWNDATGPPNFAQLGPIYIRNNTVKGMVPDGAGWDRSADYIDFCLRRGAYTSNVFSWSDWNRIEDVQITDNVFDLPASEQIANVHAVRARAIDGLYINGNTFQGTTVDAPTAGYGYNTNVSGDDIP